jgi:hypothetical protein
MRRVERLSGTSIRIEPDKSASIPTRRFELENIVNSNKDNLCLQVVALTINKGLGVPKYANVNLTKDTIHIKDKFIDLRISITKEGHGDGVGKLKSMLQLSTIESMKYGFVDFSIKIEVVFEAIRSGHPLMKEYRKWVSHIINELKLQFSTNEHLKEAEHQFILYKNVPIETLSDALRSMKAHDGNLTK